jgi:adenylate kinase
MTPKIESVCDDCGGKLYQRSDDNLESFQTRYQTYLDKTEPIIKHYKDMGVLTEVDGNDTVENIFQSIDKIIR